MGCVCLSLLELAYIGLCLILMALACMYFPLLSGLYWPLVCLSCAGFGFCRFYWLALACVGLCLFVMAFACIYLPLLV